MRILTIRLKNINSLRGEHVIDFRASPLYEAGLFGIVGATGSGKSTLLDSITLALFGSIPRINGKDGEKAKPVSKSFLEKGLVLTKHEKDCYAEVSYECKSGIFKAIWSVGKSRTGSFRNVEMKVFNAAGDQISDGLKDAPRVNTENIGLDYDQFVKSILLCQGDFAKFLQSGNNERALMLEKITGTHEFRRIGKDVYKVFNKHKRTLENKEQVIKGMGRNLLADEALATLEKEIESLTEQIGVTEKKLDEAKEKLGLKNRLKQLGQTLDEQKARKAQAEQDLAAFDSKHGAALQHYDRLFIHKDGLAEHLRLATAVQEATIRTGVYIRQIREHDEAIEQMVMELRAWLGEEVSASEYMQHLRAFRDKVRDAQATCDAKQAALRSCLGRLKPLLQSAAFQYEKSLFRQDSDNEQLLSKLRGRKDREAGNYRNAIAIHGFAEDQLQNLRVSMTNMISDLGQLKLEVRSYKEKSEQVRQASQRIAGLEGRLQAFDLVILKNMLYAATEAYEKARLERDRLLDAERLEDLRKSLKDGEPCPLCGSEHHPYLHGFAEDVLRTGDVLVKAKQEFDRCRNAHEDGMLQVGQIRNSVETERQLLEGMEQERLRIQKLVEGLKQQLGIDKVQHEDKVQELIEAQKQKLVALDECIRYLQWEPQALQLEQDVDEHDALVAKLGELKEDLSRMYAGRNIDADCQARETAMQQRQGAKRDDAVNLKSTEEQKKYDEQQLMVLKKQLEAALLFLGYDTVEAARALLISESQQKTLLDQKSKITQVIFGSNEQIGLLTSQWEEASGGDDATVTLEQQQHLVNETESGLRALRDRSRQQYGSLQADNNMRGQLLEHEAELRKLQEDIRPWEMLNNLIGDATGNTFNNRAQELTLQHLLILANRRMDKLHSRYKLLMPEKMEDDDLRVEDGYMGNEVRTVRSLSGGETFIISLALALGLSDLASRDIRIDSLFVDEGFGSLDPDTLEEAMSTLEQLQSESNKTVGIISHVESLKERIYTQIRLTKSNSGFSTLSIFPEAGSTDEAE